ncbi:MAG: penicillin-binding transpeptidase domain-containing protein [Thermoanaerobaculia bacterium]
MTDIRHLASILLFGLLVLLALLAWIVGIPVRQARERLLAGDEAAAIETLGRWARLGLRGDDYEQLLSAAHLAAGDEAAAESWLARAARRGPDLFPAVRKSEVGPLFLSRGLYEEFLRWDAAVRVRGEGEAAELYRAAAQLGAGRENEAKTTFAGVERDEVESARYAALERSIARRQEGSYPLVMDRDGRAIALWQIANRDLVPVNTDFAPLVDRSAGSFTFEANLDRNGTASVLDTTLDARVQKAALAAIAPYRASLVAIDTRTHEILAAASSPGEGGPRNLAFAGEYEPGSIVKVLTALAAYDAGIDPAKQFPMECDGVIEIDGRQFFDWARHGTVATLEEAMAVSCNLAFARIGLDLGRDRLTALMRKARFGQKVDLGAFEVPLGREVRPVDHDFMLANYAIGLEVQRTSALHLAMLADMLANGGVMTTPRLVRARRSILGDVVPEAAPAVANRVAAALAVAAVFPSLRAVVTDVRGTGRRAALPNVDLAMKTGTAGDVVGGYDSVVLAFAPAQRPRIAIGMIAENAGPAELAGAAIVRDFFTAYFEEAP